MVDVQNFISGTQNAEGLYNAANIIQRNRSMDEDKALRKSEQKDRAAMNLQKYLDPKDYLTGTDYDPKVVEDINGALQEAMSLNDSSADVSTIRMTIAPKVAKINEYSQKAKLINSRIKQGVEVLKQHKGYNLPAIETESRKAAFYDDDGNLRDLNEVDPNQDWISETVKKNPLAVTTDEGLDDFVNGVELEEFSGQVKTSHKGINRLRRVGGRKAFYEDYAKDEKGNIKLDANGNPVGLDVMGGDIIPDEKGNAILGEDGKPMRSMDRAAFFSIMQGRPAIADRIAGKVEDYYKRHNITPPKRGEEAWENTARAILGQELRNRKRSKFTTVDDETKVARLQQQEAGVLPAPRSNSKSGGSEGAPMGNLFDKIMNTAQTGSGQTSIKDGKVYKPDGSLMHGSFSVKGNVLPADMVAILKKGGVPFNVNRPIRVETNSNGEIIAITPDKGTRIDRDAMVSFQKKYDTERKGEGINYGNQGNVEQPKASSQPAKKEQSKPQTEAERRKL